MSRTRCYTIECDECRVDINSRWPVDAISQAKDEGWKLGKRDLCPDCKEVTA